VMLCPNQIVASDIFMRRWKDYTRHDTIVSPAKWKYREWYPQ
jgi:hypothetical protein